MSTSTPTRPDAGSTRLQAHDPAAATSPSEPAGRRSPWFVLRRTLAEFREDRGSDLAGSLTLWTLLAAVPGLGLLLGLVGLTGQTGSAVTLVDDVLSRLLSGATVDLVTGRLTELGGLSDVGSAVLVGASALLLAWAANGYVRAFSRVTNTVHEVPEGRPSWRLRPAQLVLTLAVVVLAALALALMVVTGPVAQTLGDALGLSADVVGVWSVAQWPLLALVVVVLVTLLLHATPT